MAGQSVLYKDSNKKATKEHVVGVAEIQTPHTEPWHGIRELI